jgi:hypothetical protein
MLPNLMEVQDPGVLVTVDDKFALEDAATL